ncbi:S9 family peptidase [Micromonospora fluostatini]
MTATTVGQRPARALLRSGFAFSPAGTRAVSLGHGEDGATHLEAWSLDRPVPYCHRVPTREPLPARCQVTCSDDGRVLLVDHTAAEARLTLLVPGDGPAAEVPLGTLPAGPVRLLPAPDPRAVAYALTRTGVGTTIWRVDAAGPPVAVAVLPGTVGGAAWLGPDPLRLGFTHHHDGRTGPAVIDLADPQPTPQELPAAGEPTHLLLAHPATGVVLAAHGTPGRLRLAWTDRHGHGRSRPVAPFGVPGTAVPLALAPDGTHLAVAVTRHGRSTLLRHDLATGRTEEIGLPAPGRLGDTAAWNDTALTVPFSATALPPGLLGVPGPPGTPARFHTPAGGPWTPARRRRLPGPAGPIEAMTYGDPAHRPGTVLVLHGGPEAAWDLGFDPLAQHLHAAGLAVVAPNQRGSTGYGDAHRYAIRDAWGGPDLADVLALGDRLRADGAGTLTLYGTSYGAFLAVLAAACRPDLFRRAVAVAPFLSGARLRAEASAPVRRLVDRLGGATALTDDLGPRDLLRLHPRQVPLLLVHGARDEVIPVSQSRALHARMRAAGAPVRYLELPDAGHDPFHGGPAAALRRTVTDFLRHGPETTTPDPVVVSVPAPERR